MVEIKDLLTRFNDLLLGEEGKQEIIRNAISLVIKTEIKPEDIKIKNSIIYLNIKPIYKSEILLKQDQIFLNIRESLGKKSPTGLL